MEGMRFTRNRQNTCSFGKLFGGKSYAAARAGRVRRYSSSQVTFDSVSRSETRRSVLFEIEILCILLFLNQNKNSQNSPKRMHPKFEIVSTVRDNSFAFLKTIVKHIKKQILCITEYRINTPVILEH